MSATMVALMGGVTCWLLQGSSDSSGIVVPEESLSSPAATTPASHPRLVHEESRQPAATDHPFPVLTATDHAEVREVLAFTQAATSRDAPELRRVALSSPDPLVVGNALRALGRLRMLASDPQILALATDPRPRVPQDLALGLGLEASRDSVSALLEMIESPDLQLRTLALRSLGQTGDARAHEALRSHLRRPLDAVELAFTQAALRDIESRRGSSRSN